MAVATLKKRFSKIRSKIAFFLSKNKKNPRLLVPLFAAIGVLIIAFSQAATFSVSIEPENGTLAGCANKITGDTTASGGSFVQFGCTATGNSVVTYPTLPNATTSSSYQLTVGGKQIYVEKYLDVSYARLAMSGSNTATITASQTISSYSISPKSYGISGSQSGNILTFNISKPQKLIITINGLEKLFLFVDPIETSSPQLTDSNVTSLATYGVKNDGSVAETANIQKAIDAAATANKILLVPPGLYLTGELKLRNNSQVYLQAGSILKATSSRSDFPDLTFIYGNGISNAKLYGRGELDANGTYIKTTGDGFRSVRFINSTNINLQDFIARDSSSWTIHLSGVTGGNVTNVKIINNTTLANIDGIDPDMASTITIDGAFIYTSDDCHAIKTTGFYGLTKPTDNIMIKNGVCWTVKSALKVGTETFYDLSNITFQNNDVVHADRAMSLYIADGGNMHDIHYIGNKSESIGGDIRQKLFEFNITNPRGNGVGYISNVEIRDWVAYQKSVNTSTINGFDSTHQINGITFTNNTIAGTRVTGASNIPMTSTYSTGIIYN